MKNKILFVDTETGGLDPDKNDLLSIGMVVWENGKLSNPKEILIKGSSERVTAEAMKINKIDLNQHNVSAMTRESALVELLTYLDESFDRFPIKIGGHNVGFDVSFLKKLFSDFDFNYSKYFSHRIIDTSAILQFVGISKSIASNKNRTSQIVESSDQAFKEYKISIIKSHRHTALADSLATAELFTKLVNENIATNYSSNKKVLTAANQRKIVIRKKNNRFTIPENSSRVVASEVIKSKTKKKKLLTSN